VAADMRRVVDSIELGAGTTARLLATSDLSSGRFGLFEWNMAADSGGAAPHFHRTIDESFYVLSGTPEFHDGRGWATGAPGDYLYVPEGGVHGFRNISGGAASMLILFTPGPPRERYFLELAEVAATGRTLSDDEWLKLWARHDQYPARFPA
jgi:mannose-6-phosphate isomerase-like protein (cupin superfamily)